MFEELQATTNDVLKYEAEQFLVRKYNQTITKLSQIMMATKMTHQSALVSNVKYLYWTEFGGIRYYINDTPNNRRVLKGFFRTRDAVCRLLGQQISQQLPAICYV